MNDRGHVFKRTKRCLTTAASCDFQLKLMKILIVPHTLLNNRDSLKKMTGPMNGIGLKHTFSSVENAMFQNFLDHAF